MNVATFLAQLTDAGVTLTLTSDDKLRYRAPSGYMTPHRLAFLATNRSKIIANLKAQPHPMPPGVCCPWCRDNRLIDDPQGMRCFVCQRLAFLKFKYGLIRSDCNENEFG
jgi:hypothetical protein